MRISIPTIKGIVRGSLRDVTRIHSELWEIKIGASISNKSNLVLGLNDEEINDLIKLVNKEKKKC